MRMMIIVFTISVFTSFCAYSSSVREWWGSCNGIHLNSTCLNEDELAKFKTLCTNGNFKKDCQKVIDYVVAKTRMIEAKTFLTSGFSSQMKFYSENHRYSVEVEKIWSKETVEHAFSFVFGLFPSCDISGKGNLIFGKSLRADVLEFQSDIQKIYESLASQSCSDVRDGFVLVAIGKVTNSKNDFEVFTIDQKKNIKVIRSGLGLSPFTSRTNN